MAVSALPVLLLMPKGSEFFPQNGHISLRDLGIGNQRLAPRKCLLSEGHGTGDSLPPGKLPVLFKHGIGQQFQNLLASQGYIGIRSKALQHIVVSLNLVLFLACSSPYSEAEIRSSSAEIKNAVAVFILFILRIQVAHLQCRHRICRRLADSQTDTEFLHAFFVLQHTDRQGFPDPFFKAFHNQLPCLLRISHREGHQIFHVNAVSHVVDIHTDVISVKLDGIDNSLPRGSVCPEPVFLLLLIQNHHIFLFMVRPLL